MVREENRKLVEGFGNSIMSSDLVFQKDNPVLYIENKQRGWSVGLRRRPGGMKYQF